MKEFINNLEKICQYNNVIQKCNSELKINQAKRISLPKKKKAVYSQREPKQPRKPVKKKNIDWSTWIAALLGIIISSYPILWILGCICHIDIDESIIDAVMFLGPAVIAILLWISLTLIILVVSKIEKVIYKQKLQKYNKDFAKWKSDYEKYKIAKREYEQREQERLDNQYLREMNHYYEVAKSADAKGEPLMFKIFSQTLERGTIAEKYDIPVEYQEDNEKIKEIINYCKNNIDDSRVITKEVVPFLIVNVADDKLKSSMKSKITSLETSLYTFKVENAALKDKLENADKRVEFFQEQLWFKSQNDN